MRIELHIPFDLAAPERGSVRGPQQRAELPVPDARHPVVIQVIRIDVVFGLTAVRIVKVIVDGRRDTSQGLTQAERRDSIAANIPLRRIGQPEDIAYCALYLASDEASWVTGTSISVDGGETAH